MDGALNNSYHRGFYTAFGHIEGNTLTYGEYKITGPSTANGTSHKYEITYVGNNTYAVVVDGTIYKKFGGFYPGGSYMNIGLETNYKGSYWATNYTSNHNRKDGNGTWSAWQSGTKKINDSLGTGYTCAWTTYPTAAKYYHP